jgi:hypothetical protein
MAAVEVQESGNPFVRARRRAVRSEFLLSFERGAERTWRVC